MRARRSRERGRGDGEGGSADFGGGEEDVLGFVGPVKRDGGGEGNEEVLEGEEGFVLAEAVAEAGPAGEISGTFSIVVGEMHVDSPGQMIEPTRMPNE